MSQPEKFEKQERLQDGTLIRVIKLCGDADAEYFLAALYLTLADEDLLQVVWPAGAPSVSKLFDWARGNHVFMCFSQRPGDRARISGIGWIGTFESLGKDENNKAIIKAEVGMCFTKAIQKHKSRGTSLSQEFCDIMLDYGFHELNMAVAYGTIPVPNKLARRFAKRMGFTTTAIMPNFGSWPDANGIPRVVDCEIFSVTQAGWACRDLDRIDKILSESGQTVELNNERT